MRAQAWFISLTGQNIAISEKTFNKLMHICMQQYKTIRDPPLAEDLNIFPSNNCLILKRLIESPSLLVGGADMVSLVFINFSKNSVFLSVVRTSTNISTSEVKQAKWPNLWKLSRVLTQKIVMLHFYKHALNIKGTNLLK